MAAEAGHHPNRVYVDQLGNLHLNGAALYDASEVNQATTLGGSGVTVGGVAAGYLIARGATALDGSNPTPVVTGLTTVVGFAATLQGSAAPGVGTSVLTHTISSGTVSVYAWKPTSNADPTLIASTGTETFSWVAVGT